MMRLLAPMALLVLAGCATPAAVKYAAEAPVTVSVSTYGGNHDFGISDHLLPDSQVYVGGKTGGGAVGSAFGLVGLAVGAAVDQRRNEALVSGHAAIFNVKFDGVVARAIEKQLGSEPPLAAKVVVRARDSAAKVHLLPAVRLHFQDDAHATMLVRLVAFHGPYEAKNHSQRVAYTHALFPRRPLADGGNGWADQGGHHFRSTVERAYERLAATLVADIAGKLRRDAQDLPRLRVVTPASERVLQVAVLWEQPEFYAVLVAAPDGELRGRNEVFVVDRAMVAP